MTKTAERQDEYISLDEIAEQLNVAPETVVKAHKMELFPTEPETGEIPRSEFEQEEWTPRSLEVRMERAKSDRITTWVFSLAITVFAGVVIGGLLGQIFSY